MTEQEIIEKFGFKPEEVANRYRSHWIVKNVDPWDEEDLGVKIGYLCVVGRDGASNPPCTEAFRKPNFIGTFQDSLECTYRHYYFKPLKEIK